MGKWSVVTSAASPASEGGLARLERGAVAFGAESGVIAMDRRGNVAMPFNSSGMYRGYIGADGRATTAIYRE